VQRWDDDRGGLRREFGAGPATEEPREAERPARERERERERVISVLTQWGATLVIQLRESHSRLTQWGATLVIQLRERERARKYQAALDGV